MIAIVHSIYSQSLHAPALNAGLMDNDAERYCTFNIKTNMNTIIMTISIPYIKFYIVYCLFMIVLV